MTFKKKARTQRTAAEPVVVVSKRQFELLMGPDKPSEVPSALRELVLSQRAAHRH